MPKMIRSNMTRIYFNNSGIIRIEKGKFYKYMKKMDHSFYKVVDTYGNGIILTHDEFSSLFLRTGSGTIH
ncbi:hypothetical protein EGCR1_17325 (plasmid) [Enterococcus gilvus]|jgi:hypothetical protein|uniref:hypothetical protein n=1 Tax=Enterococcus TaxID=1350 RepID=UPI000DF608FA|nr:hypothetical protein [Enterococcus gilvus]AXG40464.1 hypothetical protein EGCR1_17325 [Enterococcus gilvus]